MNNWFSTSYCYVEPKFDGQELQFKSVQNTINNKCHIFNDLRREDFPNSSKNKTYSSISQATETSTGR